MSWSSVFVSRFPSLPWSSESSQWKPTWLKCCCSDVWESQAVHDLYIRLHDCSLTPRPLELSWTVDTESKLADVRRRCNHSLAHRPSPLPKKISRANPLLCHILQWWCTLFYLSCIRPHLEYACTVRDPYLCKGENASAWPEAVQKFAYNAARTGIWTMRACWVIWIFQHCNKGGYN